MKVCIKSYYFDLPIISALVRVESVVLGDGGHVSCYEMVDIESKLGLGRNSLVSLFIILWSFRIFAKLICVLAALFVWQINFFNQRQSSHNRMDYHSSKLTLKLFNACATFYFSLLTISPWWNLLAKYPDHYYDLVVCFCSVILSFSKQVSN